MIINDNTNKNIRDDSSLKIWQKRRYLIALLAFFGFFNVYALRTNLSIAIVAMTENKTVVSENGTVSYAREFEWDSKQQGFILSSFFYGYIVTQFPGGWLAAKYGGRTIYGVGIMVTAVLTLLTPLAAKQSFYLLICIRVIEGLFEGVTYPCVLNIWSHWAPPLERSRLVAVSFSGGFLGIIVSMPASACLSDALGWESIFYVFGGIAVIWYICWALFIPETPFKDKYIKDEELNYLKQSLEYTKYGDVKPPWMSIIKSPAIWAIIFAHFSENWGYYTLLTQLPKFMKDILHFDLAKAGLSSALPYLVMGMVLQIAGFLADWFQLKGILNTTQVRKLFTCAAFISQTIFMLLAAYLLSPIGTTACISIAVGLGGFAWAGFVVNYLDVAPQYASVLLGIGNTIGTLPGVLSPIIGGYIVVTPSANEWRTVFFISSGIYLVGAIIYGIFASGKVQKWAAVSGTVNKNDKQCSKTTETESHIERF